MKRVDKRLHDNEIKILSTLNGREIENIQGAFRFDDVDVWNTLRIFSSDFSFDVNLFQEEIPAMDEESCCDETGVFSIELCKDEPLVIDEMPLDVKTKAIFKKVRSIKVFESEIKYFEKSVPYYQVYITKAIAFEFDDSWLVLDRKVWFDEAITVTLCANPKEGIRNDEEDWENGGEEDPNDDLSMEYKITSRII